MTMAVDPAPVAARPSARAFPSSVLAGEECLPPSWDSHTSRGHTGEADCEVHRVLPHREASPSSRRKRSGGRKLRLLQNPASRYGVKCSGNP